jgi:hypothetical protein
MRTRFVGLSIHVPANVVLGGVTPGEVNAVVIDGVWCWVCVARFAQWRLAKDGDFFATAGLLATKQPGSTV